MLKQDSLKGLVQKTLQLSPEVSQYIADMLVQDPPFNQLQTLHLLQDFIVSGSVRKQQAAEMSGQLFALLKQQGNVTVDSKFNLTAQKLPTPIILGETMLLENQDEFQFKRMTGGNSNNQMVSYQKKERKKDKEQDRAKKMFEQHHQAMNEHMKKLPPTIVNHTKGIPRDLIIDKLNLIVGGRYLLQQATLKLVYGRKYGLVGRNGIGKTCLMNALARNQFGFHGMQILLVEQEVKQTQKTALNTVLQTDVERLQLLEEQKQIVEKDGNVARLQSIHQRMQEIDAHTAEVRAQIILGGLGFTPSMMQKMVKELSGGWRMRVALARALFVQPEILLLDEPTNHLDLDAVMWLQDYISKSKATVVVVSHARQFLNVVCTDIVHFVEQKLVNYRGDYDCFQKTRYEKLTRQKQAFDNQQSKISHMQEFIDKFRYNAKRASLVQSRIKAIQKLQRIDEVIQDPTCVFIFPNPDKLRPPLLRIQEGAFGYVKQQTILRNVNIGVDMQSRIAIVGANGVGKSTLLKLLVGSIQLNEGNQSRNPKLKVSIFTQHHIDTLDLILTPLQQFMRDFPGATQQSYRNHLGSFGIGGNLALRPQYLLSGGQKSRVAFALAVYTVPHLLVLDEPTNHLDIDAVNALIIALNNYSGGVIIVSHDQHLIATVCDNIWYIKDSRLKKFSGDFQDYRKALSLGRL